MGRTSEERMLTKQKEHFEERMNEVNERQRDGEQLVKRKVQRINKEEMKAAKKKYGD